MNIVHKILTLSLLLGPVSFNAAEATPKKFIRRHAGKIAVGVAVVITLYLAQEAYAEHPSRQVQRSNNTASMPVIVWQQVAQQSPGLSCGYHAVKNAIALSKDNHDLLLHDFTQGLIGPHGVWQEIVAGMVQNANNEIGAEVYQPNGENLDEHGVQQVIALARKHELLGNNETIDVISDVDSIPRDVIQRLQQNGTHPIVLRTGSADSGHWIAVVVKRGEEGVGYTFACSLNNQQAPQELMSLINTVDPNR